jgi:hypothetical protein
LTPESDSMVGQTPCPLARMLPNRSPLASSLNKLTSLVRKT